MPRGHVVSRLRELHTGDGRIAHLSSAAKNEIKRLQSDPDRRLGKQKQDYRDSYRQIVPWSRSR
jgi:hypothetical protein